MKRDNTYLYRQTVMQNTVKWRTTYDCLKEKTLARYMLVVNIKGDNVNILSGFSKLKVDNLVIKK